MSEYGPLEYLEPQIANALCCGSTFLLFDVVFQREKVVDCDLGYGDKIKSRLEIVVQSFADFGHFFRQPRIVRLKPIFCRVFKSDVTFDGVAHWKMAVRGCSWARTWGRMLSWGQLALLAHHVVRIDSGVDVLAEKRRFLPRLNQGCARKAALEHDFVVLPIDPIAEDPVLGPGGLHEQPQSAAVGEDVFRLPWGRVDVFQGVARL